jgi:hypothetical protein
VLAVMFIGAAPVIIGGTVCAGMTPEAGAVLFPGTDGTVPPLGFALLALEPAVPLVGLAGVNEPLGLAARAPPGGSRSGPTQLPAVASHKHAPSHRKDGIAARRVAGVFSATGLCTIPKRRPLPVLSRPNSDCANSATRGGES